MRAARDVTWSWSSALAAAASLAVLSSCSTQDTLLLYNASGHPIMITRGDGIYALGTGEAKEVHIDPMVANHVFHIQPINGATACYVMVRVSPAWLRPGRHGNGFAKVDERGHIYMYPSNSDPATFYQSPPPADQPANFPLKPKESAETCVAPVI